MYIEEKRARLKEHCQGRYCNECALEPIHRETGVCYSDATDEEIERNYAIIFGSPIKPDYYNDTKIAPIDVIEDWDLDFCLGSALKYIKRCGKKENNPSVQDLKKVIWYIERRIKELEEASK